MTCSDFGYGTHREWDSVDDVGLFYPHEQSKQSNNPRFSLLTLLNVQDLVLIASDRVDCGMIHSKVVCAIEEGGWLGHGCQ